MSSDNTQTSPKIKELLQFWFGDIPPSNEKFDQAVVFKWFRSNPSFDQEIRDQYGALIEAAEKGELSEWEKTSEGSLALITIHDQLRRNIFRGTPRAFAMDVKAQELAVKGYELGFLKNLHPVQQFMFLMPLMHSESRERQADSLRIFTAVAESVSNDNPNKQFLVDNMKYVHGHKKIIDQLGRFPSRNEVLKRESTPEELQALNEGWAKLS